MAYAAPASDDLTLTAPDVAIGGLQSNQVYYVVSVDANHIRLSKDYADAVAAEPIAFTGLGSGNDNTITAAVSTIGIGDSASLSSSNEGYAYPTTGCTDNHTQHLNFSTASDVTLAGILSGAKALFKGFTSATDETGNPVSSNVKGQDAKGDTTSNEGLTGAGGARRQRGQSRRCRRWFEISPPCCANGAVDTGQHLRRCRRSGRPSKEISQASASKPEGKGEGSAVALAVAVGIYNNTSQGIIEANTISDAGMATTVSSDVDYPILIDPAQIALGVPAAFASVRAWANWSI